MEKDEIWCDCPEDKAEKCFEDAKYVRDNMCECGVAKHHYHGGICGKIVQIG